MNASTDKGVVPVITMKSVTVCALREPQSVVAADVNWTAAPGEFWAIAGLQGAGKSDFLMTAAGLLPARTGEYRLFGEPMPIFEEHRLATRLRLGLVFDGGQVLNHLTVAENVALPLRYHRDLAREEIDLSVKTVLEATGLLPRASSTPSTLSRPWRKRAGLARALMLKPEVLLVDDPLGGLDHRHADWWLKFLDQLAHGSALLDDRSVTLVVTTAAFRPWSSHARQFASLAGQQFTVVGDWNAVQSSEAPTVRTLREGQAFETAPATPGGTEWTAAAEGAK